MFTGATQPATAPTVFVIEAPDVPFMKMELAGATIPEIPNNNGPVSNVFDGNPDTIWHNLTVTNQHI